MTNLDPYPLLVAVHTGDHLCGCLYWIVSRDGEACLTQQLARRIVQLTDELAGTLPDAALACRRRIRTSTTTYEAEGWERAAVLLDDLAAGRAS